MRNYTSSNKDRGRHLGKELKSENNTVQYIYIYVKSVASSLVARRGVDNQTKLDALDNNTTLWIKLLLISVSNNC